eukprot:75309_1
MGNKCLGSSNKEKLSQDDLEPILAIDPQDWTQGQVIKWLQLTHDGDLRDLIDPFKAQKISGVTFVKLSEENLKNDLEIKQFGLRDGFISARNKLLQQSKQNKLKPTPQQPSQTQTQAAPQQPSNANINTTPNDPNHEQDSLNAPDLRQVQQLSPKLAKYKKGTKVRVWSNSKQTWVPGVVIDVVPTYEVVNVRYGDHEKLVPVSSDDIKLLADNTDDHHNQ